MLSRSSLSRIIPVALLGAVALGLWASPAKAGAPAAKEAKPMSVLDFKMKSLSGKEVDLESYQGDVVLAGYQSGHGPSPSCSRPTRENRIDPFGVAPLGAPASLPACSTPPLNVRSVLLIDIRER